MSYEIHEACAILPKMSDCEFADLCDSIKTTGYAKDKPIVLHEGKILDGRHRYLACQQLGVEPVFDEPEIADPYEFVMVGHERRSWSCQEQKYFVMSRLKSKSEELHNTEQAIKEQANAKRSEATEKRERTEAGTFKPTGGTTCAPTGAEKEQTKTRTIKAEALGVNRGAVQRAEYIERHAPQYVDKIATGEMKPTEALRKIKREQVGAKAAELPNGKYRIIYADPPWQYNDSKAFDGASAMAAADHYPTMKTSEICALEVPKLAADDCVLFMWATFPLLPDALEVVKAWKFKYKTAFVWDKGRANFGNYHNASAELLIVATKGSCTPDRSKRFDQIQTVRREGRHSEKPEHFREMINAMYEHGPRIELFRRGGVLDGWHVWGNEADQ